MRWFVRGLVAALLLCQATIAGAGTLGPGTFQLGNHPDGTVAAPFYGLRLDGIDGDSSHVFSFDFEHAQAGMQMILFENGDLQIFGTAFGGRVDLEGDAFIDPQLWVIDFTYNSVTVNVDSLFASPGSGSGSIIATETAGGFVESQEILLVDEAGDFSFSFALENDHRGFAGQSGFGWLNHSVGGLDTHVHFSDWLFTVESFVPVPEPGSLLMVGMGLVGLAASGRRARTKRG